ncbi:MAG: PDZ domain-containing protein [bacterium]|nr:MAG: PDZ domain-containing protein [bacterium]
MKSLISIILIGILFSEILYSAPPKEIYLSARNSICLVSFYQNMASDSKIGSFDKIKKYRIGILVRPEGLVMVSNDVYPVSLDFVSSGGSLLSGIPTEFKVKMADGQEYPAHFLGKDDQARVAFIKMHSPRDDIHPFIEFVPTLNVEITDSIYTLELLAQNYNFSPLFTGHQINAIVESPQRKFLVNNFSPALSAGGLVLNRHGQAIGVMLTQAFDFTFMQPGDFEDFQKSYLEIAPSEWFMDLIKDPPNLQENQLSQKSWLGIQMQALTPELKEYLKVPQDGGIIINQVFPESPAAKAKLKIGDIILAIDDSTLLIKEDEQTAQLRNLILSYPPQEEIQLKIFREGKILQKKVKLTSAPKAIGLAESFPVPEWGFEIRELTRDIVYRDNLPLNTPGVFVYQVDRASPAGIGGLQIGDIIQEIDGREINDFTNGKEIISAHLSGTRQMHLLKVLSNHHTRFVFVDLRK